MLIALIPTLFAAPAPAPAPYAVVLGVAQDAGHPQAGCKKSCCAAAWEDPAKGHLAASLGIVDPVSGERWIIDATPDLPAQLRALDEVAPTVDTPGLSGILLTHAHIGHYTGLTHLGREVMGASGVPVYAMPRMMGFLSSAGPWEQLVSLENITLVPLEGGQSIALNARITVTPMVVPHRDEYSETVGFLVAGPSRSFFYLPDIDKWDRWYTPIEQVIAQVDRAWLDGTFYADGEIPGREMSEIPHPFIAESLERLRPLPDTERAKVHFIHLNHTNPVLQDSSDARGAVIAEGFGVAAEGDRFEL
jgi:pyrroloquinoline quinone biosynthesis protein B